jgi:hypothetical protein
MPKSKDTSALAFVGQIQTEHKAVLKADGEALKHAIECGKYLNLAKENVLAAKGKWTKWREDHIPEISQQTASLYMRLAENEERVAECESIREADVELRKPRDSDGESDSTETESDEGEDEAGDADDTNNALLVRKGASLDLATTFKNTAVDEVYTALTQAWDADQLRDLVKRVNVYLATRPPTDLAIPSGLRRPLTPAQPSQG